MTESFIIQSDIANLPRVEERLFHFCRECNVGNYYSAMSVAVTQAVKNAIVHGNESDPGKEVTLTFDTPKGGVAVTVTDQGAGFDFSRYGELPSEEAAPGEGIFIMKSLADHLSFSDGGRSVTLGFDIGGIEPVHALERVARLQRLFAAVPA